jgi:starch synthase (maltosyl-transferring)
VAAGPRSGTFRDCINRLPDLASMGFDVIYLPPVHPIGRTHRKGKNNKVTAEPGEPGSPWGIGNEVGGHKSLEPSLGTFADFDAFVRAARSYGIEIALDFAIQCSPDHPWVKEHPSWFSHRPDGTIKYGHGVKTFRVDNPHTKPIPFWEWLIREVKHQHPDVIFLAEAFTRPRVMQLLAKVGFTQSYTYFTWRNEKKELTEYRNGGVLPWQLLRQHAGHLARLSADWRPAGVQDSLSPSGNLVVHLRHLQWL